VAYLIETLERIHNVLNCTDRLQKLRLMRQIENTVLRQASICLPNLLKVDSAERVLYDFKGFLDRHDLPPSLAVALDSAKSELAPIDSSSLTRIYRSCGDRRSQIAADDFRLGGERDFWYSRQASFGGCFRFAQTISNDEDP
jgi:hypothetical protein